MNTVSCEGRALGYTPVFAPTPSWLILHPPHCMEYVHAGIVGAGTNNARLAGLLRGLGSYYYKEPTMLFLVRIAQGLVHMGKGLLTLNPYHTDNQLVSGLPHPSSSMLFVLFAMQDGQLIRF